MAINFFKHPLVACINEQLEPLTRRLRPGDTIKVIHTPVILPLGTSNEIGGYARSLGLPFGPKRILINCNRLAGEHCVSMREFILARQVALFDKSSRCLHLPLAAIAVATAAVAVSILFADSMLAMVTIAVIVALASAAIVAKRERENELYADVQAFRICEQEDKEIILDKFFRKVYYSRRFLLQNIFSGYPSAVDRFRQLNVELQRQIETVTPEDRNLLIDYQLGQLPDTPDSGN